MPTVSCSRGLRTRDGRVTTLGVRQTNLPLSSQRSLCATTRFARWSVRFSFTPVVIVNVGDWSCGLSVWVRIRSSASSVTTQTCGLASFLQKKLTVLSQRTEKYFCRVFCTVLTIRGASSEANKTQVPPPGSDTVGIAARRFSFL